MQPETPTVPTLERPRRARWFTAAALAVALLATGTACGKSKDSSSGSGSAKKGKPLVIGVSLPLSGDFSQPGGEAKKGYEIWRDMVNAKGGLLGRPVRLKITDDASNQDTVVSDYTRLISQDRVDLLLGTFSSLLNYPASAVAEKNGKVYVEPAGGAPKMFTRGFKKLFFAQQATAQHQADVFVDLIKTLPDAQKPKTAAYPTQDDPFTRPVIESMQSQLEGLGVRTVYSTVYPPEATNFQTVAGAIAAKKPDLVAQGAVFEDGVGLIRSLKQVGYSPKIMFQTSAPSNGAQYSKGIGVANTEGVFYTVSWSERAKTPLNPEFVAEYGKRNGGATPAEDAADAFATAEVLQAAVEKVGKLDQNAIADWLHSNTVQTILGPLSWNDKGEPQSSFILGQWQKGRTEVVAPKSAATTSTIVDPKPAWQ